MQMPNRQRTYGKSWLIVLLLPFFTHCTLCPLSARMEYLSRKSLASYRVKTPDPNLNNPPIGQRLIINWSLPRQALHLPDLYLKMTLRFRNGIEEVRYQRICRTRGTYKIELINDAYFETCGIQTYKIEILGGGTVLERWCHQLYTDLIIIEE